MPGSDALLNGRRFDRRVTPARPDLAAASLRGAIEAGRFVEGWRRRVVEGAAPLRRAPSDEASLETEALYGESVIVYEEHEGWAWAQLERDGYVGFMPAKALGLPAAPTHRLAALRSFAYPGPSIKLPPAAALSLGARLAIKESQGEFGVTADGWHVYARHLAPVEAREPDFVAVAERFLEVPYLWGGRTSQGIDCSGLVQTALAEAGVSAPRDSDMMEAALGAPVVFDDALRDLRRGDLVFWKGHIGIMRDAETLLHANGWHMKVVAEPLRAARDRTNEKAYGPITAIRRL
jgi:cell wall-associated NlpC family hydrolase